MSSEAAFPAEAGKKKNHTTLYTFQLMVFPFTTKKKKKPSLLAVTTHSHLSHGSHPWNAAEEPATAIPTHRASARDWPLPGSPFTVTLLMQRSTTTAYIGSLHIKSVALFQDKLLYLFF